MKAKKKARVVRTERGWPAHFCCVDRCSFRRNTLVSCGRRKVVVSTVGNMRPRGEGKMQTIGLNRYYETMVFRAIYEKPYWEADVGREVPFDSPWALGEEARNKETSDLDANDMHERVVDEMVRALGGE